LLNVAFETAQTRSTPVHPDGTSSSFLRTKRPNHGSTLETDDHEAEHRFPMRVRLALPAGDFGAALGEINA
jgi:hypothetical protein